MKRAVLLACGNIQATLVRTPKRKSVGIYVKHGKVEVRAPMREPLANITEFVRCKEDWIQAHLTRQQTALAQAQHSFSEGDRFYFLGKDYPLLLSQSRPSTVALTDSTLNVALTNPSNPERVRAKLEAWYKEEAGAYLQRRTAHFAERLQLYPKAVSVRRYKSRWGSCNHRGELQFNWLIMMAPPSVVDYLVVHELCHLRHFDHSPAFWQLVETILPGYRIERRWLQQQTQLAWPEHDRD